MDAESHKRYLDYLERHTYFGRNTKALAMEAFESADTEFTVLLKKEGVRSDEEEERFEELEKVLLRD